MDQGCELLDKCGFFRTYRISKDMACKGFINIYCRGPRMNECKRKEYRKQNGIPPSDNMMPSGQIIADR